LKHAELVHLSHHPQDRINRKAQQLDMIALAFDEVPRVLKNKAGEFRTVEQAFINAARFVLQTKNLKYKARLDRLELILNQTPQQYVSKLEDKLNLLEMSLQVNSPQLIMAKGYCILRKGTELIRSVQDTKAGERLEACLRDGKLDLSVLKIAKDEAVESRD